MNRQVRNSSSEFKEIDQNLQIDHLPTTKTGKSRIPKVNLFHYAKMGLQNRFLCENFAFESFVSQCLGRIPSVLNFALAPLRSLRFHHAAGICGLRCAHQEILLKLVSSPRKFGARLLRLFPERSDHSPKSQTFRGELT